MALTSILKEECPTCGKVAVEKSKTKIGNTTIIKLMCGHSVMKAMLRTQDDKYKAIKSSDGYKLRQYQIDGIKFLEQADANAILADEQGTGKTIHIQGLLQLHPEELLPAILVCPTTVKSQWMHETIRWNGRKYPFTVQVINSGKEIALPGFGLYIITYDILKKPEVFDMVDDVKTIIIDECQRIKNHLSERAKAVQQIVEMKKIVHVIPMSGTPIKNHAGEYFTVLNLVDRRKFPHYQAYLTQYCDTYQNGWGTKVGGIRDVEAFKEATQDIILRRTKKDVLPDLPPKERKFYHVELDKRLNKAYAKALDELDDLLYSDQSEFEKSGATIALMSRLRHITGQSKVDECIDFVTEHLLSNDRKIAVFTHHQDVADRIILTLNQWCEDDGYAKPLHLHSGLDGNKRYQLQQEFNDGPSRVLIASTLAAGEAINLQKSCSDAVMLERQWNPANEEQAEDRFHRFGQESNVSITYMIASGTIDEYFSELVESKRAIVSAALDHKEIQWNEQSLMKELAELLVSKGRDKWRLP